MANPAPDSLPSAELREAARAWEELEIARVVVEEAAKKHRNTTRALRDLPPKKKTKYQQAIANSLVKARNAQSAYQIAYKKFEKACAKIPQQDLEYIIDLQKQDDLNEAMKKGEQTDGGN